MKLSLEKTEEIADCLRNDWQIRDIAKKFKVCFATIRTVNKIRNCGRTIPSEQEVYYKNQVKKNSSTTYCVDRYGVALNTGALNYFIENSKQYFSNDLNVFSITKKNYEYYEPSYYNKYGVIDVRYIYNNEKQVFFKYKFINDFHKNKLKKENLKELIDKKNMFEKIQDSNNEYCVFDLDRYINDKNYKEAIKTASITRLAPKI